MGLFDKLKSLVSDDKKDTGTIEIVAPLSGEIVNIEDVPDVVFAEKIVGDGIADQFKHYLYYQYEPEDLRDPGNWCDWVFICICDCDVCAY